MARKMAQSHAEVVPTTVVDEADIDAWTAGIDITVRLIRAIAAPCNAAPALNAWYDGANESRRLLARVDIGVAYVLTANRSIPYANMDVALAMNDPIFTIFSLRSGVAPAGFLLAALVISYTRIGRDGIALGSDRRASMVAGVNVDRLTIGVFTVSGTMAALSGVLLSYGLAAASPVGLADVLVPGTAAAIIGGISLSGGRDRSQAAHDQSLFDLDAEYADVVSTGEVVQYLRTVGHNRDPGEA